MRVPIVTLGNIAQISSGGTPDRGNPSYWKGNIPWVKTTQIQNGIIREADIDEWISEEGLKNSAVKVVPEGTILMAMYGQGKTRGQVAILGLNAAINQACAAIQLKDIADRDYVFQQLLFRYKVIRGLSNTGSQENLNAGLIRQISFPLPKILLQRAIAAILFSWDSVIEKTEKLIEAKERRFSWMLNRLINQESVRGKWRRVKLGEVVEINKGQQLNVADMVDTGKYYALNGGIEPSGFTNNWNKPENTITISEGGNSCGFVNFNTEKFWCGGHCYALNNLSGEVSNKYLYHYLKAHEQLLMALRVGSGLPNIQRKDLLNFTVVFPPLSEQNIIADVLNTARQEIDILKKQADAYRKQKRGLMQKLLTGEWRVKVE